MPKSAYSILIAAGVGYLLLKLLPNLTQSLQQNNPLVRPLQSTLTPTAALAGATFGIVSSIGAALNKGSTPVAPKPVVSQTLPPSQAAGGLPSLQPNFGQGAGLDADQGGLLVSNSPAATNDLVAQPIDFMLPDPNQATLSSVIGQDLPLPAYDPATYSDLQTSGYFSVLGS